MKAIITKHAYQRAKERFGLDEVDLENRFLVASIFGNTRIAKDNCVHLRHRDLVFILKSGIIATVMKANKKLKKKGINYLH